MLRPRDELLLTVHPRPSKCVAAAGVRKDTAFFSGEHEDEIRHFCGLLRRSLCPRLRLPILSQVRTPARKTAINLEVLLVDPELDLLANRALLLIGSGYRVTTTASYLDVFETAQKQSICPCDPKRHSRQRGSSRGGLVREKSVAHGADIDYGNRAIGVGGSSSTTRRSIVRFEPKKLLEILVKLSEDPWNRRSKPLSLKTEASKGFGGSDVGLFPYQTITSESDPAKAVPHDWAEKGNSRDIPSDTHGVARAV